MRFKLTPKPRHTGWRKVFKFWVRTQDHYLVVCEKVWCKYLLNMAGGEWIYQYEKPESVKETE